jgi:YfiH family protein
MLRISLSKNKKYYLFTDFPDASLVFGFSTRISGNMSLFHGDTQNALENRKSLLEDLGADYRSLVCAKQVHASSVRYIKENDAGKGAISIADAIDNTDSFITDKTNLPLAIFTADCLSIFLYDCKSRAIGLVHAGWRSSKDNIAAKTVKLMSEKFGTKPCDLYVGFGPAIRKCCYEVGDELSDCFDGEYFEERDGRYYLDLPGINKQELLKQGIREQNIIDSDICTACHKDEFFSYRSEGNTCARLMSIAIVR